jgi:protein-disulfide isomerase
MAAPQDRGLSGFYWAIGAAALLGTAAIGYLVLRRPAVSIPANVTVLEADTAGFRGYLLGADSAPLEVTEYADYQCPACQQFTLVQMPSIEERLIRTGRVRWRYRDFPLDQIHPHARLVAHAAACAADQGKYWDMHRRIYRGQPEWSVQRDASGTLRRYARELGLDLAAYDSCMEMAKYAGRIEASKREGERLGVPSTPTFLINGRLYSGMGTVTYDVLKGMLDSLARVAAR